MTEQITYGGKVIGQALKEENVECLFGVHGFMNLAIEEANTLGVKMYHFRHEQSAGFAADAYARATRKPGVCFASTAPGFTNYVSAIAQAYSTLSPVVLLIGQHGIGTDHLKCLQEGYGSEVFKTMTKYTHRCVDWNMNSFWVRKALKDSMNYPPGPIVLEFPINNINNKGPNRQQKYISNAKVVKIPPTLGDPMEIEKAITILINAKRPLLVTGDGVYWSHGEKELKELAELLQVPVNSRRTGRGALSEDHPLAVTGATRGNILGNADVICIVSLRATGLEEWFEPPDWTRRAKYIQIQEVSDDFWYGLPTEVGIMGTSKFVLKQMIACARTHVKAIPKRKEWLNFLSQVKQKVKARQKDIVSSYMKERGHVHPHVLGQAIANVLDESSTVIYDGFTATAYLTDKLEAKYAGQVLDAGYHQALGQGIGMAVGAQIARSGKQVLALAGDGGFGISAMDMETLLRYSLPAVIVLFNNSSWGGRSIARHLYNPRMDSWDNLPGIRYDRMFKEMGCHIEYVENPEDVVAALENSFQSGLPSLVHVVGDATKLHPVRYRLSLVDAWTRDDINELPEEAIAELRGMTPMSLLRTEKSWRDWGLHIPIEELADLVNIPIEEILKLKKKFE
jgi:acetolactate synthase I/II/III large subunit